MELPEKYKIKDEDKKRLSALLESTESTDPAILECIHAYNQYGLIECHSGSNVLRDDIHSIYTVRQQIYQDRLESPEEFDRVISGFEYLLSNLKSFPEKSIRLYGFRVLGESYIIFTNCDVSIILGIISIQKK